MVTALGVALLLVACGPAGGGDPSVGLVPDAAASGGAWVWTARCPLTPEAAHGCRRAGPVLGSAQLSGDEWNLGAAGTAAGSVRMSIDAGGAVAITGNLRQAPPCTASTCLAPSADTWVRGYPSVLYGLNQCHARTSAPASGRLPLPLQVKALPAHLTGTTSYRSQTSDVTYDIAYDMWLNNSDTRTPCQTDGTVEVLVVIDYDETALLPDSLRVGTASIPAVVNGKVVPERNDWSVYVSNIDRAGQTVPWGGTVWFVLDRADVVSQGTVSVDLSGALSATGALLQTNYGWSDFARNYWLDSIPFGLEFGPAGGETAGAGPARFALTLSSYCLAVEETPAAAGC